MDSEKAGPGCVGCLIVVIVAFIVLFIIDAGSASHEILDAVVVSRTYTPSTTQVGTTSNGDLVVTGDSEKWNVVVKIGGTVRAVSAHPDIWPQCNDGRPVKVQKTKGGLFGLYVRYQIAAVNDESPK